MKRMILAGMAVIALLGSSAAMARVDVDISIGGPSVIYAEPDYYYPPIRYVERPRVVILPERVYKHKHAHRGHRYYEPYRDARFKHHHYKRHHKHHHRPRDGWHN